MHDRIVKARLYARSPLAFPDVAIAVTELFV
jgi:hypothetical protein